MGNTDVPPLIIGFVADLMSTTRIESAATRMDYRTVWISTAAEIAPPDLTAPRRQLAEHLVGPGAVLIDKLTLWRPALIIFDLGNALVPWREWIALIKSVPATRRIPVVCFGSHVEGEILKAARNRGADAVLARSRFFSDLPGILQKYIRLPDYAGLSENCKEHLSDLAIRGLEQFNRGEYFEAHESLEEAWNEDVTPGRELYRAILQVAVAYLQIERGNYKGALKMFLRVRQWIEPLPEKCRGVDVGRLRLDALQVYNALVSLGPAGIFAFDRRLLQPVHYEVSL